MHIVHGNIPLPTLYYTIQRETKINTNSLQIEGEAWKQVYGALEYAELKFDAFKYLEVDMMLHSYGLVVKREYRGRKLGSKILDAR